MSETKPVITVEYLGRVAVVTLDNDKQLNALTQMQYYELASRLREIATHNEVYITLLIGKGRYFSAGANITNTSSLSSATEDPQREPDEAAKRRHLLQSFVAFNLNAAHAFYTHPKILVVGLNGPVVGLSAALVAAADFVYCTPHAFLLTPFSSIGLVAEGAASLALVQRLGIAKANEALIMSRRIPAHELLAADFVNKVFDECGTGKGEDDKFRALVLREIDERLGSHLIGDSLTAIKELIRRPTRDTLDLQNWREALAGMERFVTGVPQEEFRKLATGEKRHKL